MKFCPICHQTYADETLNFCLIDGAGLNHLDSETPTAHLPANHFSDAHQHPSSSDSARKSIIWKWLLIGGGSLSMLVVGIYIGSIFLVARKYTVNFGTDSQKNSNVAVIESFEPTADAVVITLAKYNKIKNGMSYGEVVEIFGSEGEEVYKNEYGKYRNVSYKWQANYFSFVLITFQNEKVIFKTQSALTE